MSTLFIFEKNEETSKIIQQIGTHPPELEFYLNLNNYSEG